jgi:hypothetical protein
MISGGLPLIGRMRNWVYDSRTRARRKRRDGGEADAPACSQGRGGGANRDADGDTVIAIPGDEGMRLFNDLRQRNVRDAHPDQLTRIVTVLAAQSRV